MPFIDTSSLDAKERFPGWSGRCFHSASLRRLEFEDARS
jgi:hypothetical protein